MLKNLNFLQHFIDKKDAASFAQAKKKSPLTKKNKHYQPLHANAQNLQQPKCPPPTNLQQ